MEHESFKQNIKNSGEQERPEPAAHSRLETNKALEKERSPLEIIELKDRLRFVARQLSKNFDLRVIPGDGWAAGLSEKFTEERAKHPEKSLEEFDPKLLNPESIMYPEKDLLERKEDYIWGVFRHELGHIKHSDYQSVIESQEKARKEGYDPTDLFWIYDSWEDGRSNNMEGQTSKTAHHRLGTYLEDNIAETRLFDLEKKPIPIQYGVLCWAKGAQPFVEGFDFNELKSKIKDERVLQAFKKTEGALDEYLAERKGRKAFTDILWEKGWPVFKELIKEYIEDDARQNYNEKNQGNQEESAQNKPWDELSPEEKESYKQEAREKLTEQERESIEKMQPQSLKINERADGTMEITMQQVTKEDIRRAEQEEKELEKQKSEMKMAEVKNKNEAIEEISESLKKLKERETGLTEGERELYERYFNEVKKYVGLLVEKLDEVFPPQEESEWEGGYRRGKRIDAKTIAREIPIERGRVFKKKEAPEIKEVAFTLLIDISGSMEGNKIEEALKAAILMAEAFSRKGVPFEILAFNERFLELKQFDDEYFGKKKLELTSVLQETETGYARYNDDGYAVDTAARRLQKRLLANDAQGALIVFSDGQPAPSGAHNGSEWELHSIVNKWSKQIPLIGVGIGPGMEKTIKDYYGKNGLPVPDINKLPHALLDILRKQVARFEKRNQ
ncbi:MAG: VWA domain-containing protein [Patescibacteria group bacterium]|nr:VWA domain-containing protein [Patescibacteria group bacterium]